MSDFLKALAIVMSDRIEGGFSNDPKDPGNWTSGKVGIGELKGTNFGISAATYPHLNIRNLVREDAERLYERDFWIRSGCDKLSWPLNLCVFDGAVQHDPHDAVCLLQKAVGTAQDGNLGPRTLQAISNIGVEEATAQYLRTRLDYYQSLRLWPRYRKGWENRLFRLALAA